ncbi:MAG: hypothetical protein AVO34_14090 [Firmicutes bacterium ML8_F2]|jgi:hypothetical protein|nr:MAG: hypothetical protein AVO34_14090 [Firmicutes bacterium ML8_F2]
MAEGSIIKCSIEENRGNCPCTYEPCSRKGKCCECLSYHWKRKNRMLINEGLLMLMQEVKQKKDEEKT